jgi:glucuronate isomerase
MKTFISEDFLLQNKYSQALYHHYAAELPIIDYHCHLPPGDIATDTQFRNLTAIWLSGDHYKWRAMRTLGIPEKFITGDASDEEKFDRWAGAVPYTLRNPLYHWTHLELQRYFDVDKILMQETSREIYERCSSLLQKKSHSTVNLLRKMKVEVICTTDDPIDNLEHHQKIKSSAPHLKVLPTFRPDKAYAVENPSAYKQYLLTLGNVTGVNITSFENLMEALNKRIDFFHLQGGRISDHGLEQLYYPNRGENFNAENVFKRLMADETISLREQELYKYTVLSTLCKIYHKKGWAQQFHLGALRNTNQRMLGKLGPDTGFDSIGDFSQAKALALFLNELDSTDQLAKTILYNLNPSDNEVLGTMIGNFNDGSSKGKIQFGSAWWFLDQKDGMEKQINALSNLGLLSCFIGMLTDSRSFLSYPRHEYFRRILCNIIGRDVENGELPWDEAWLGKIVSDICYHNAKNYFSFESPAK